MTTSQRLLEEAQKWIGEAEIPGPGSNPNIRQWILATAEWLDPDDSKTAWCGAFRAFLGWRTGSGVVAEPYRARSWAKWGKSVKIDDAQPGDTVILSRKGGGHVALFYGWNKTKTRASLLGGNQSDEVKISTFARESIEAVRR